MARTRWQCAVRQLFRELAYMDRCVCYCEYCGVGLTKGQSTIDHKVPIVRGGTDSIANFTIACNKCNGDKRDEPYELFKALASIGLVGRPRLDRRDELNEINKLDSDLGNVCNRLGRVIHRLSQKPLRRPTPPPQKKQRNLECLPSNRSI